MAVYPCDFAPHRYPGKQRSLYITRFAGSVVHTRFLRLCQTHFNDMAVNVERGLRLVGENSVMSMVCLVCNEPYDEGFSVRLYDGADEPGVYAGEFCARHAEAVAATMLWGAARPR